MTASGTPENYTTLTDMTVVIPVRVVLYLRVSASSQTVENQVRSLRLSPRPAVGRLSRRTATRAFREPRDAIGDPASTAYGRTPLAGNSMSSRHGVSIGLAGRSPTWRRSWSI